MHNHRLIHAIALGLTLAGLAAPVAAGAVDLRSPDAIDSATAPERVDRRSPDTIDAATARDRHDRRSPDAIDAARAVSSRTPPAVTEAKSSGTDAGDVAIVAGGPLALLLGALAVALVTRRRGAARKSRTAVLTR
jgi:hypothetical protein